MVAVLVVVVCPLAGLAGAGYSSWLALCVCCAGVYRPGTTTGYCILAAQPSAQRQAANRASYTPYSPTATLSSSHYYYHILTLRNCSVCTIEYQGASDVNFIILFTYSLYAGRGSRQLVAVLVIVFEQ